MSDSHSLGKEILKLQENRNSEVNFHMQLKRISEELVSYIRARYQFKQYVSISFS